MENKIVIPQMEKSKEPMPDNATIQAINRYNQAKKEEVGEWVYSQEHGIVWNPTSQDLMGGTPPPPKESPPSLLGDLVQWGKTLDLDNVKPNSVLIVKLSGNDSMHAQRMQQGIISMVLAPRAEKLKDKKLTVLFMASDDNIELISEEDMNEAGWQKKEKSIIIEPFKR